MCTLADYFKEIDTKFNKETDAIISAIENRIKKTEKPSQEPISSTIELFETPKSFPVNVNTSIPSELSKPGIYIFVITPSDKNTTFPVTEDFNQTSYAPRLNRGEDYYQSKKYKDLCFGEILYLGKSESKLNDRLNEHINNPTSDSTYALRLSAKERKFLLDQLTCFCLLLNDQYKGYKKTILPAIENRLHEHFKPRVGSKRT